MHKIRDWLYIGKYRETLSLPLLNSYNIGAMLHLAEDVQHEGIETLYLGIDDGVPVQQEILRKASIFWLSKKRRRKFCCRHVEQVSVVQQPLRWVS